MTSEVRFELPDPAFEQYTWVLADEHTPVAAPPLTADLFGSRAPQGGVPTSLRINGYTYNRDGFLQMGPSGTPPESVEQMRLWRREWLPEVDKVVDALSAFDPKTVRPGEWAETLEEQSREYWRVFGAVHRLAVIPSQAAARRFQEAYVKLFGEERSGEALALLQGFPNASLERAALLWEASRVLHRHPDLLTALDRGGALPETAAAAEFRARLQAVLDKYGSTSEGFVEDQPVWAEDPSLPLAAIRAYARLPDGQGPLDAARRQRERREQLEAALRSAATADDEAREVERLMRIAQEHLPNLEDHNYLCDQRLSAASRQRWLAIGRHLAQRGVIDAADDVFYFYRPELVLALDGETAPEKALLQERREQLAAWRAVSPPPVLGRPLPRQDGPLPPALRASEVRVLRGVAASPGSYRGRARVVDSIQEAASLEAGDVLVCRATTPAWTPFFALIGALVANSGGLLSHSAVVAREFGIPAVIGAVTATVQVPDGATVTVDGTSGLVVIEG
ncbi:MAG TPA: PEP-utilizing enzyme [Dehalococcoidia bacterium]|nr:PEP-utilizing enzyme [Dehalococcoidia bacterium]